MQLTRTRNWEVEREDVMDSVIPDSTETHKIVPHSYFVETSEKLIEEENLPLKESKYYMSNNQMKYFGKYVFEKKIYPEDKPEEDLKSIRQKYLKLSKEHHPDILMSKGVPTEVIEESKKKMRTINSAWDQIQKLKSS